MENCKNCRKEIPIGNKYICPNCKKTFCQKCADNTLRICPNCYYDLEING